MNNKYSEWLNDKNIKEEDKKILKKMTKEEIKNAFSFELKFGTAGIRGLMGLGSSRMNEYTIGKATVGLALYLNKYKTNPSVVIAYDTRNNSKDFALNTALILNYYGIKTYLFDDVRSTPELSFAVKYLKCTSGIVITSSHNPKEYNGYKVYNEKGGQIVHPEDDLIISEINNLNNFEMIKYAPLNNELFNIIGEKVDKAFECENEKVIINQNLINEYAKNLKITYSSLHGVGYKPVTAIFNKYNINYNIVKEQCTYDGNFPYANEPNPEYRKNYDLAIKYAKELNSDVIIETDPDADRLGVMIKENDEYKLLNGNVVGCIFAYYLLTNSNKKGYLVRSIVSTPMIDAIAKKYNCEVIEVLTGCKNIANKKEEIINDNENYIFGFEESLGYMFNIDVNDKNSISSIMMLIEILCYLKSTNISLSQYINKIYEEIGYYMEETISFTYSGLDGSKIIEKYMNDFRNDIITFNNENYTKKDYLNEDGELNQNALKYVFNDNSWIMLRPSGTEPKIKIYMGTTSNSYEKSKKKLEKIKIEINNIFNK